MSVKCRDDRVAMCAQRVKEEYGGELTRTKEENERHHLVDSVSKKPPDVFHMAGVFASSSHLSEAASHYFLLLKNIVLFRNGIHIRKVVDVVNDVNLYTVDLMVGPQGSNQHFRRI